MIMLIGIDTFVIFSSLNWTCRTKSQHSQYSRPLSALTFSGEKAVQDFESLTYSSTNSSL